MFPGNIEQKSQVEDELKVNEKLPLIIVAEPDHELENLVSKLSPQVPWGERQDAIKRLGYLRSREALQALISALPNDPFWMVRCAIIQAMEVISDPGVIPILKETAKNDRFAIVRAYAASAIEFLSRNK
jgi:HEAT repeat protein